MGAISASSGVDTSLPLSTLLRQGTSDAHRAAENSPGASWLVRAQLDKEEYVRFLMMLWHVYNTLEHALDKHASHPVLEPTYNPTLLSRASHLASDIAYYLQCSSETWQSHPVHIALLLSKPKALKNYITRLQDISDSADPSPLLAHAYVRYLGDLSGGQYIKRNVANAYGARDDVDGNGLKFYEFRSLDGMNRRANAGDMKQIKEWYREGMNVGVGDGEELKLILLKEANRAFALNLHMFSSLKPPSLSLDIPPKLDEGLLSRSTESSTLSIEATASPMTPTSSAHLGALSNTLSVIVARLNGLARAFT